MSGASEQANGRASDPVLQSGFLVFLDHSIPVTEIRETIGKNISEMERLENLMQAVNELKKIGKSDEKADTEAGTEEGKPPPDKGTFRSSNEPSHLPKRACPSIHPGLFAVILLRVGSKNKGITMIPLQ